jgi:hypothetical protein
MKAALAETKFKTPLGEVRKFAHCTGLLFFLWFADFAEVVG